ncbi:MAG: serine hydrolase domain-containing protein [Bacteroidota bacterium]
MYRITSFFVLLLSVATLTFGCVAKETTTASIEIVDPDQLDEVLDRYVTEGYYPFVYARLEDRDGKLLYEHSTVNEKLLPNTTIDGDTWIRIWSMSKIVTISVVLDLVEDGILNLEDAVAEYIPEFANLPVAVSATGESLLEYEWGQRPTACPIQLVTNDSVMTIRHLIDHEAGFYYATSNFPCLDSLLAEQNIATAANSEELIERLAKLPLVQHSGTDYFYGTNTTILGLVAERATGKSLKELVTERVTEPLQIAGLQYGLPSEEKLLPRFTGRDSILREAQRGELDIFGPDVPEYAPEKQLFLGGEGMVATTDGYADFIRMLLRRGELNGHRFLDEATVADIHAPHTQLDNPYGHNGYNLWVSGDSMRLNQQGDTGLWIGGGYECTHFWVDPKRNFVGLIMSQNNAVRPPGYDLNDKFRGALYEQIFAAEEASE